jgi:hypothetical protein
MLETYNPDAGSPDWVIPVDRLLLAAVAIDFEQNKTVVYVGNVDGSLLTPGQQEHISIGLYGSSTKNAFVCWSGLASAPGVIYDLDGYGSKMFVVDGRNVETSISVLRESLSRIGITLTH